MTDKIKLGVSACLLGEKVRSDGGHKHDHYLTDTLGKFVDWEPVCPEVEYSLPTPREAMRLVGEPASPKLVTIRTGHDHTKGMQEWAAGKLKRLEKKDLCGFIFKNRSPGSGYKGVKVYSGSGMPSRKGTGIFAGAFVKHFPLIPVEDEGRLHDPVLRENFIERVFVFNRWKKLTFGNKKIKWLIEFHTDHKLLIMSHSQKHYSLLGRLAAQSGSLGKEQLFEGYVSLLMEGIGLHSNS